MSAIECGRGHLYDPNIYAACPYCNSTQQAVYFAGVPVGEAGKTAPLSSSVSGVQHQAAASEISVLNDGKTLPPKGYQSLKHVGDENKTIGIMKEKMGIDPVVGWLVCIEGNDIGADYKVRGQINTIGRSDRMDICIRGDKTISNENHARLSYSEKNNRFHLIPAESKNIIFLNEEEIFAAVQLQSYDVIDFGETKLMFIPFCGEKFTWKSNNSGGDPNAVV